MPAWTSDLREMLAATWQMLAEGAGSATAPARHVVLATTGGVGPEARIVALRAACRDTGTLAVHTDIRSMKWRELRSDPRGSILAWDPGPQVQLRLRGAMRLARGAAVAGDWAKVPAEARGSYGMMPPPGTPLPAADAYERRPDPARFAVLTLRVTEIDAVVLAEDFHRRALFRRADGWGGTWLAP